MIDPSHITPTRWFGLLGFGLAALICGCVSRRRPAPWRALAVIHALFLVEIVVGGRHALHDAADVLLKERHLYPRREAVQLALIGLVALLVPAGCFGLLSGMRRRRLAGTLAVMATAFVGALVALEVVSLHAIDLWMYRRVHGVMVIGIGWAVAGAVVAVCALIDARNAAPPVSGRPRVPAAPRR